MDNNNTKATAIWLSYGTPMRSTPMAGWQQPQLKAVNRQYPLSSSQIVLERNELDSLLNTLVEAFRSLSLETAFQDSPVSATCRSLDQTEFEVSIFQSQEEPNTIILELQRRSGDTITYHNYANQILATVNNGRRTTNSNSPRRVRRTLRKAPKVNIAVPDNSNERRESVVVSALELAWGMLSTERFDAQRLGLESLVHLTNEQTSGGATAKAATEYLLSPEGAVQEKLSQKIIGLVCHSDPFAAADASYLALVLLSQILQVAVKNSMSLASFLQNNGAATDVVGCLLSKLQQGPFGQPNEAYFAAKCLTALCALAPATRDHIKNIDHVEDAESYGDSHHSALAGASHELWAALQA